MCHQPPAAIGKPGKKTHDKLYFLQTSCLDGASRETDGMINGQSCQYGQSFGHHFWDKLLRVQTQLHKTEALNSHF